MKALSALIFVTFAIAAGLFTNQSDELSTRDLSPVTLEQVENIESLISTDPIVVANRCVRRGGDCTYYRCCAGSYCRKIGGKDGDKICQ